MKIWHLRFSSEGRHPLFPTERARRAAVLLLVRHAGAVLVAFGIVDDHLHVVVLCPREQAGKLSRALVLGLRPIAGLGFEPSFLKQVESRAHLVRLVSYCIEQPAKHGLGVPPAMWSGSCFADLVGARVIDGLRLRTTEVLPRYWSGDAWRAAGLPSAGVAPATDAQLRDAGLRALRESASFAACARPDLEGRSIRETRARALVVCLGRRAGYRSVDLAASLAVTPEAVRQLGQRPLDARLLRAVRLRLGIVDGMARDPKLSGR